MDRCNNNNWHERIPEKKAAVQVLLCLLILIGNAFGQDIINNPEKPKNKKSGRVVALEEVSRIRDDGANVVFRNPKNLTLLKDGSLLFRDGKVLYKYEKNGKIGSKFPNQGSGPGECQYLGGYFIDGDRIHVYSWAPPKVMAYDFNGKFLGEQKSPYYGPFEFLGLIDHKIFGIRDEIRFSAFIQKEGFFETPFTIYEISEDFKNLKKIYDIPVQHYIKKANWWRRFLFVSVPFQHWLFIVHTSDYAVSKINLSSGKIETIFKRRYARLKSSDTETEQDAYQRVPRQDLPPPLEYVFDILWIQIVKNTLWVFTSTTKEHDNINPLVDIFDLEGRYIDCFYLKFPPDNENHWVFNALALDDGFIFFVQENKETGLISIAKYRVRDDSRS